MPTYARRFFIEGRVQGVGFRWFAQRAAGQLGLDGYARNLADGRVEVYAAGGKEELERLAALLASGPPRADVRRVETLEATHEASQEATHGRGRGFQTI